MKRMVMSLLVLWVMGGLCSPAFAQKKENERLRNAATVLSQIQGMPDGIPKKYLDKAGCIVVFPSVKKFAIGIGGSYGRGVISCRGGAKFNGPWSAPAMFALEGASIGLQLGGSGTDFVLLVMNDKGADSVLTSKVKLGADASAAAGPKGRDASAETDIVLKADILSYSRSHGLFAGVSLEGSTLRADGDANKALYGKELSAKEIVRQGKVGVPAAAQGLLAELGKESPKHAQ
jgi:lipid-binding SYLF domain-containing protein